LYRVEDGCPSSGKKVKGSFKSKDDKACVRCCLNDGATCSKTNKQHSKNCGNKNNKKTYDDAEAICKASGERLCKKEELLDNLCCGTGGNADGNAAWALSPSGNNIYIARTLHRNI
jgi:hypothetical protein